RGSAALERADDIDFRRAGLLPGEAHADEQNHETDRAVEGVLQFEKGRSQAQDRQQTESLEGIHARLRFLRRRGGSSRRPGVIVFRVVRWGSWLSGCGLYLRRPRGFVLADLREIYRDGGQSNRRIGECGGRNLITESPNTSRTCAHGLADEPAYGERNIANPDAGNNSEGCVADESGDR